MSSAYIIFPCFLEAKLSLKEGNWVMDYTAPRLSDLPLAGRTRKTAKGAHGGWDCTDHHSDHACKEHCWQPLVRRHRPKYLWKEVKKNSSPNLPPGGSSGGHSSTDPGAPRQGRTAQLRRWKILAWSFTCSDNINFCFSTKMEMRKMYLQE